MKEVFLTGYHNDWLKTGAKAYGYGKNSEEASLCVSLGRSWTLRAQLDIDRRGAGGCLVLPPMFPPVLTGSRSNKLGIVCNANSSHKATPTLKLKYKWSSSSWHWGSLPLPMSVTQTVLLRTGGRRKRAEVWLGRRRETAFRLKCFWSQKHYKQLLGIKTQRL